MTNVKPRMGAKPLKNALRLTTVGTNYATARFTVSADIVDRFLRLDRGKAGKAGRADGPVPIMVYADRQSRKVSFRAASEVMANDPGTTANELHEKTKLLRPHRSAAYAAWTLSAPCDYVRVRPGTSTVALVPEWDGDTLSVEIPAPDWMEPDAQPTGPRIRQPITERVRVMCHGVDLHLLRYTITGDLVETFQDIDRKLVADGLYASPGGAAVDPHGVVYIMRDDESRYFDIITAGSYHTGRHPRLVHTRPDGAVVPRHTHIRRFHRPSKTSTARALNIAAELVGVEPGIATKNVDYEITPTGMRIHIDPEDRQA